MQNKILKYLFLFTITYFLSACSKDTAGIFDTRKSNADQFLIEKKAPLELPPDFNELPTPETINKIPEITEEKTENKKKFNIKKLFKKELEDKNIDKNTNSKFEGIEKKILDEINKN